jgi:protein-histidine pros-kinase
LLPGFRLDYLTAGIIALLTGILAALGGHAASRRNSGRAISGAQAALSRYADGDRQVRLPMAGEPGIDGVAATINGILDSAVAAETELRDLTAMLRNNEQQLQMAMEAGGFSVWDWDRVFGEITFDRRFATLLGYAPGERVFDAGDWRDAVHPEDVGAVEAAMDRMENGTVSDCRSEYRLRTRAGNWKWVSDTSAVVARDIDGVPLRIVGTIHDITVRKETEQALQEARDRAVELARDKANFVAGMSHELRTPLNGVLGMVSLLKYTTLDAEQREYVEAADNAGHSLLRLINDLLDFSKLDAGRMDFEHIDFGVRALFEEACEMLAGPAHQKGLELICDLGPDVPLVLIGDPTRIRQVVVNLLGNAIKFTERGEIVVTVRVGPDDARPAPVDGVEPARLYVEVRDTGIGIAEEARARLFRSFSQADMSTTRRYGGTGLGLAISQQMVTLMGGSIDVVSSPGAGSLFRFNVEVAIPAPEPEADHIRSGSIEVAGPRRRVLVVTANASLRMVLARELAELGIEAEAAADAPVAAELMRAAAAAGRAHVAVFIDQALWQSGPQVADAEGSPPPVRVLLTPFGDRFDDGEARRHGFAACLTKPVRAARLRSCVQAVLDGRRD